jgi:hypothetical protein
VWAHAASTAASRLRTRALAGDITHGGARHASRARPLRARVLCACTISPAHTTGKGARDEDLAGRHVLQRPAARGLCPRLCAALAARSAPDFVNALPLCRWPGNACLRLFVGAG